HLFIISSFSSSIRSWLAAIASSMVKSVFFRSSTKGFSSSASVFSFKATPFSAALLFNCCSWFLDFVLSNSYLESVLPFVCVVAMLFLFTIGLLLLISVGFLSKFPSESILSIVFSVSLVSLVFVLYEGFKMLFLEFSLETLGVVWLRDFVFNPSSEAICAVFEFPFTSELLSPI